MTKAKRMSHFFMNAFYLSKFKDRLFIVKASGDVVEDDAALDSLIANCKALTLQGINLILIYGGGKAVDAALEARGISISKKNGRRVTDAPTLEVMKEVIGGRLAIKVTQTMARHGFEGYSFNTVPPSWMRVALRSKTPEDFGFVGDVKDVDTRAVQRMVRASRFIACPSLVIDETGQTLNINADTIATELAIGTQASKLIFLSNVDGVLIEGKTAFIITVEDIPTLIKNGIVTGGMQVKLENCARALTGGVRRIHLLNGLKKDALYKEIFESVGPGTMLLNAAERDVYMNEIEIQKAFGNGVQTAGEAA